MNNRTSPYYTSEHCSTTTTPSTTSSGIDYTEYNNYYNEYDNSAWIGRPGSIISTWSCANKWRDEERYVDTNDEFNVEMFGKPSKGKLPKTQRGHVTFEDDNLKSEIMDIQVTIHELTERVDEFIKIGNTFNQIVQSLTALNQSMDTHHEVIMTQLKEMQGQITNNNETTIKTILDSTEKTKEVIKGSNRHILERIHLLADITTDINERISVKYTRE